MSGLRMLRLQKRNRYSVERVAEYLGCSVRTYHTLELHPEKLTLEKAEKLAAYLDCTTSDLISLPKDVN